MYTDTAVMDFTLDPAQEALAETAAKAMERERNDGVVRRLADDPVGVDAASWRTVVDLGWTGLLVDGAHGGAGGGLLDACIVVEQAGRVPLPGPLFSSAICATLAARALGAGDLLPSLAAGTTRGTLAIAEQGHGDPLRTVATRARRKGNRWLVTGTKPLVLDACSADWAIVVAGTEEGPRCFLVDPVEAEAVPTLDPTRKAGRLHLVDRPATPLGPDGSHAELVRSVQDDIAVALGAENLGVAERALEIATAYTKERVVFGRPVASFQVVKHKIVDMLHLVEMARVGVQFAAWAADTDDLARARAAAMAAGYASEAAVKVAGEALQLHGGVGFTWDCDAHFLLKRAKQNDVLTGGHATQRRRLATMLVDTV